LSRIQNPRATKKKVTENAQMRECYAAIKQKVRKRVPYISVIA
jgi:hypothetical protein